MPGCNDLMDELRHKMELKMIESAELYYKMENYQSAATTYENILEDFPETSEAENIGLRIIRSYFNYAGQSVTCKKPDRYEKAIESYSDFRERFPESGLSEVAKGLYNRSIDLKNKPQTPIIIFFLWWFISALFIICVVFFSRSVINFFVNKFIKAD